MPCTHAGNLSIKYELKSTSTGVCITCTFLNGYTTDCVAVVHQRISQLSSSGLMNIESSHKFNRSGDTNTAYGCIPDVDLEQYQVGVVGGILNIEAQPKQGMHPLHRYCIECLHVTSHVQVVVYHI